MKYEIIATPPGPDRVAAVREEFDSFLTDLEQSETQNVNVIFGFAWGNQVYGGDWIELTLTASEIRSRVSAAESRQLGRIGGDDFHVSIPASNVERLYCHEADIHIVADGQTNSYLQAQQERWQQLGWQVSGRRVT